MFLRGRIQTPVSWNGRNQVDVRYGIEQLFVEQGSGVDIEERRGIRGGMQNAMHARIAIGADGSAVLTGYTWSDIAIGLEITDAFALTVPGAENADAEQLQTIPALAPIRLTISNVSRTALP